MCIIAIKPQGKKMINDSTISTMFINNDDGAGYMFYDKKLKKVVVRKGFMTCKSLLASLHSQDFTNTNVVIHFRIGTSGTDAVLNTHPFPVYDTNAKKFTTNLAVVHNGIMPSQFIPKKDSPINDTQIFIKECLSNLKPNFVEDDAVLNLIEQIIGTNKLAFLSDKNKVTMIGNFIEDNGYYFSNGSYRVSTLYPRYYSYIDAPKKAVTKRTKVGTKLLPKRWDTHRSETPTHSSVSSFWDDDEPNEFWDYMDEKYA